jgi:hypothetical protein
MNKEDLKLIPRAIYGISLGVLEYIVKPKLIHETSRLQTVARAAIYHYSTEDNKETKL